MKAAQIEKYGNNTVVKINRNTPKPALSADKILIEVHAAGVNPVDWKIREGLLQEMIPLQLPATLGMDYSGVVKEVGANVTNFKIGDAVFGWSALLNMGSGSFAEWMAIDANTAAHKPKKLSHNMAAALPLAGVSAWQALVEYMKISPGQKILIHGGAGGIGIIAIQLAKHLGAYVATTVSARDQQFVKDLGADEIIVYKASAFEERLRDYDAVLDTQGGETYNKSFNVLKKAGIIVSMLEQPDLSLMQQYGVTAYVEFTPISSTHLSKIAELVGKQKLKIIVDKIFSLDHAVAALDYQQNAHPRGKVVLQVKQS